MRKIPRRSWPCSGRTSLLVGSEIHLESLDVMSPATRLRNRSQKERSSSNRGQPTRASIRSP